MDGHNLLEALTDLMAFVQRGFVALGSVQVMSRDWAAFVFLLPLLVLPFAATRQLGRRRWWLGLALAGMELYLIHNRLTLFSDPKGTLAATLGNAAFCLLGLLFAMPLHWWLREKGTP